MLRQWLFLLLLCSSWSLRAAIVVDTGTAWLYNLTIGAQGSDVVEEFFFAEQLKDHGLPDSPQNYWDPHPITHKRGQRVLRNTKFWSAGKPIFVHIGGEAPIHSGIIGPSTTLYQLAKEQGAMILALEHRYYSEVSNPTPDLNRTTRELLSVSQALDDAAHYIETLVNKDHSNSSKVIIAFGYGYGGNLAAWARQTYPHIFDGAVASSAPCNATFDFQQYFQKLDSVLSELDGLGTKCKDVKSNILGNGLQTLYGIIKGGDTGRAQLILDFGLNASQIVDQNSSLLWAYNDLITPIGQAAVRNTLVQDVCVPLTDAYNNGNNESGYDALQDLHRHFQTLPKLPARPAWIWQSCRELGFFQTTHPGSNQPFQQFTELDVKYLSGKACTGDFLQNDSMPTTDQIYRTFGGMKILRVESNITFIQGCYDPWSTLGGGDTQNCQREGGPIYISGCAHAPDFLSPNPACPNNKYALCQIRASVNRWLGVAAVPWGQCTGSGSQVSLAGSDAASDRAQFSSVATIQGKQHAEAVGSSPACAGLLEVVVKPTRSVVKAGDFAKVKFDVRVTNPNVNNRTLLVGVQYPNSDRVFFAKGTMTPRCKNSPIVPQNLDVHDIEGIYWSDVPLPKQDGHNGRWRASNSYSFTAKFLTSPLFKSGDTVELYPGACLNNPDGVHYCCQAAAVKLQVKAA